MERWQKVLEIYDQASQRSGRDREQFVTDACGSDSALSHEVRSLLARPISGDFLRESAIEGNPPDQLAAGQQFGPFEVGARLGAGGMGVVYRARDPRQARDVALKILPRVATADPEPLARFEREAQILAALDHPQIAALYGIEERDGAHALVLELVEGPTLAERMSLTERVREPLTTLEALDIARQIADALVAAHGRGIIHRDLTPANIKITPDGVVKVLDFGLAKMKSELGSGGSIEPLTVVAGRSGSGALLGTAVYMSPEQTVGEEADHRSDIWAVGLLLYEMVAGQLPIGPKAQVSIERLAEPPSQLAALPKRARVDITRIFTQTLARNPADRYQDVTDLLIDLESASETLRGPRPRSATRAAQADTIRHVRSRELPRTEVAAAPEVTPSPDVAVASDDDATKPQDTAPAIDAIDPSDADALIEIRRKQRLLREYRARTLELKDVEQSVVQKVLNDYDGRYAELERKAAPSIGKVQKEYRRMQDAWNRIKQRDDEARLLKCEAELRHRVGEIDDAELAERVRLPDRTRATCAEELTAFDTIRARFLEALDGVDTTVATLRDLDEHEADTARLPPASPGWQAPEQVDPGEPSDATVILPDAVLVLEGAAPTRFRLSAMNYIGRGEQNQVRLVSPGVSHRHALVVAGPRGYSLKDCESAVGTRVNGAAITEHQLVDGDRIQIGEVELLFQMPGRRGRASH